MKNRKLILSEFSLMMLLSVTAAHAAANFNIVPTPGTTLPTAVSPGATVSAYYTVTNQTSRTLGGYTLQGLPGGVTQNTSGSNCGNPVTLAGKASCVMRLDITNAVHSNFALCKGASCTTAAVPLNVNSSSTTTFAYVTDSTATLWQCPLNASGGFSQSSCTPLTNSTSPGFNQTLYTTFQAFAGVNYAYVTDNSPRLWKCPIGSGGGFSGACTVLTNSPAFTATSALTFKEFSGVMYGYVADSSDTLWQCPMTATGDFTGACTALTNPTPFTQTATAIFADFAGSTFAYVSDVTDTVWKCPMNATGGFSAMCSALTTSPAFTQTIAITFAAFNNTTYGYVADLTNTLWQCPMNAAGDFSGNCTALTNTTPFSFTNIATFQNINGLTYAYVADASSNMWQCPINLTTGGFNGACTGLPGFHLTSSTIFFAA